MTTRSDAPPDMEPKGCDWCGRRHRKVPKRCARKNRAYDRGLYEDWVKPPEPGKGEACGECRGWGEIDPEDEVPCPKCKPSPAGEKEK